MVIGPGAAATTFGLWAMFAIFLEIGSVALAPVEDEFRLARLRRSGRVAPGTDLSRKNFAITSA